MKLKELVDEIMPILNSNRFKWFALYPLLILIYGSLWAYAIIQRDIFLQDNLFYNSLSHLGIPIIIYNVYSLYLVLYRWENDMDNSFNRAVALIVFGMVVWFIVYSTPAL